MDKKEPLKRFVAIDFETTGTDPRTDEIIELGAVRFEGGRLTDQYECLVSPATPIPPVITRLTGITPEACRGRPPIADVLPDFLCFLGDDPVVAHNAPFDLSFLRHHLKAAGGDDLQPDTYDTLLLSRIILPRLKNHQLGTLLDFFSIEPADSHRAAADAGSAAKLFLALCGYVGRFDLETLQRLIGLTPVDSTVQRFFYQGVKKAPLTGRGPGGGKQELFLDFENILGEGRLTRGTTSTAFDMSTMEEMFRGEGKLGEVLSGYEERTQQVEMAGAVARAYIQSEFLMVEAGTGVGKSLAYLVPAIEWALASGERSVISTKTKNLQEQLFYNDIPILRKVVEDSFKAVLLKGRTNYICLNKWRRLLTEGQLTTEERRQILPLVVWVGETVSGDISENTGFKQFLTSEIWNRLCAESTSCLGQKCAHRQGCYYQRVRLAAQRAHLVVTNHALLFSDAQMNHSVLDTYSHLILDEAHSVEGVAVQHFGARCSPGRVRMLLNRLRQSGRVESGLLVSLGRRIEKASIDEVIVKSLQAKLRPANELVGRVRETAETFFTRLGIILSRGETGAARRYRSKIRYEQSDTYFDFDEADAFPRALNELASLLSRLSTDLSELPGESFPDQAELTQDTAARAQECQDLSADLSFCLAADEESFVYWVELSAWGDGTDPHLYAAPLEISGLMQDHFYDTLESLVLTSGTLTVNNRFDYMMERLGLDPEKTVCLQTGSPFDYRRQSLVCVPSYLPPPKDRSFQGEISRLIEEVVLGFRRGTLVLFTSYDLLLSTYHSIKDTFHKEGVLLLGQGVDGSRSTLLNLFREEKNGVLLGTESFWQGVDVPGEALEILIITRLPFAVPTEPVVEARMEQYQRKGLDPFREFSVPEAVMKFRQGFGRLVRSRTDRGVVLICDTRVVTARYGSLFLKSLPTETVTSSDMEGLMRDMQQWLEAKK